MGEMTTAEIVDELAKDNPKIPCIQLEIFADALRVYIEASANIQKNGAVCAHPRTGTPVENPYLKVAAAQGKLLSNARAIKADRVFALIKTHADAPGPSAACPPPGEPRP